jgi:D-tyrosyl-tRNA(Tyr) deacylase
MKAVVQRVSHAHVSIEGQVVGSIGQGLVVLLGVAEKDSIIEADWLIKKILNCRIFSDEQQKMNLSVLDIRGGVLVVSQFTLLANVRKGNRPSFVEAATPEKAQELYNYCLDKMKTDLYDRIQAGVFGAMMEVSLTNDGPVTLVFDTDLKNKKDE